MPTRDATVPDRLTKLLWGLAMAAGLAAVGFGLSVFVEAWQTSRAWVGSAEALHADLPAEAPIWLDLPTPVAVQVNAGSNDGRMTTSGVTSAVDASVAGPSAAEAGAMNRTPTDDAASVGARFIAPTPPAMADPSTSLPSTTDAGQHGPVEPTATPPPSLPAPGEVALVEADFRFLDPPEPGAHARLAVTLQNRADRPTGPLSVVLPSRWLQGFQVLGAIPPVLDDRPGGEGERQFVFGSLAPGERQTVELHVLATAEEIDAPEVRVTLSDSAEVARARPRTIAPRPRPGPARALAIPKLGVTAAVVPVPWEPPPFVVGQLQGTAALSEGNTVLIGHLKGPAGDVFERLDRLRPGDEVVATSRGLEYRFVVSDIVVRPYEDVQPTQPTTTPRLTMMTCTGTWSIVRQDYSHRLWVVAEPPELAQQTIRANAERAEAAAREAEAAAAARATHEAEMQATPVPPEVAVAPAGAGSATGAMTPSPSTVALADPTPVPPEPMPAPSEPTASILAETAPGTMEVRAPGIIVDAPTTGATVPQRIVVRGHRTAEAPAGLALWLVVRADLEGSRWYALGRPLDVQSDGAWEAPIELGGPPGIHHEIRVGAVDAAAEGALRQHAAQRAGQPLDDLPPGFQTGARVTVERR